MGDGGHILVVGVNWIGDAIMTMPALQAWRLEHPEARLTLMVKPGLRRLWAMHRVPNAVIELRPGLTGVWRAARAVRQAGMRRAVILPHSFRSALAPFLAGVPERVATPGQVRGWMVNRPVRMKPGRYHQSREAAQLLCPDAEQNLPPPALQVPPEDMAKMRRRIAALPGPRVALLPGAARGPSKRWPLQHFAQLAEMLVARGWGVVVMGGPDDRPAAEQITASVHGPVLDLTGQTSLSEWAAGLQLVDVAVANDSGGMHLAAALGTPVVALYGITDPEITGPLGRARILQSGEIRGRDIARRSRLAAECLAAIRPERALEAVEALWRETQRSDSHA